MALAAVGARSARSLGALDDIVRQGKILYSACSNFAAWQVAHALGLSAS